MEPYFQIVVSTIGGSAIASILARSFIARSLRDLDFAVNRIGEINTKLAEIAVRLEALDRSHKVLYDLDRKVIALETKVNAKR